MYKIVYSGYMKLKLAKVKDKMIMCRFDPVVFMWISAMAKKHKTSHSKIIRAIVDKAFEGER